MKRKGTACVRGRIEASLDTASDQKAPQDAPGPSRHQDVPSNAMEVMAQAWPQACTSGGGPTNNWWATTRRSACITFDITYDVYDLNNNRWLGAARLGGLITTTSPYQGTGWDTDVYSWVKYTTGQIAVPETVTFAHKTTSVPANWNTSMVQNTPGPESWGGHGVIWNYSMPLYNIVNVPVTINWFIDNPAWASPLWVDSKDLWSRCDKLLPAHGSG